ncbi:MAG: hypothetical protein ABFC54_07640 [Thermoguttaceae bacterium]
MNTRWPAYRLIGFSGGLLTAIGFAGLWLCIVVREFQGLTERQFIEAPVGRIAVWSLSACFLVGLFLSVAAVILQKRAGAPFPRLLRLAVPAWIAWSIKVVTIALVCLMLWAWMGGLWQFLRGL